MKKICQYCGEKLGFFDRDCPNCGAVYEECSHCEETQEYKDSRYYRDPSEYGSYDSRPMHDQPQHGQPRYNNNRQFTPQQYVRPQYNRPQYSNSQSYGNSGSSAAKKPATAKFVGFLIAVVFIMISVAMVTTVLGNTGYKAVLNDYFESFENADGTAYVDAQMTSEMFYELYGYSTDDIERSYTVCSSYLSFFKIGFDEYFGDDFEIKCKVQDEQKITDEMLDTINAQLDCFSSNLDASEGYNLDLKIKIKGDEDNQGIHGYATVLKINGAWIIAMLETDDFDEFGIDFFLDEAVNDHLDDANENAKKIYEAAESYASLCYASRYHIQGGTVVGGDTINRAVAVGPSLTGSIVERPKAEVTQRDIENAINTYLPNEMIGYVYCVEFDEHGFPCAVICAEDGTSAFVGAYPREAYQIKATLSSAKE